MINGLPSRTMFKNATKAKTVFGSRGPLLVAIGESLDEAHATAGKFRQCRALLKTRACCEAWIQGNPHKTPFKAGKYFWNGSTGSHRYDGVTTLAATVDHLLNNDFREQFNTYSKLVGSGDSRIGTAQSRMLSNDEYIAEFLDPKHRSKASVLYTQYLQNFDNHSGLSFQQWLANRTIKSSDDAQKFIDMMWPDSSTNEAKKVLYLDGEARKAYRLEMRNGRYFRPIDQGAPFHTADHQTGSGDINKGWAIFVLSPSGYFYAHSKDIGKFHHSTFLAGTPTLSAGCIAVDNGVIVGQNNASGHYKPGQPQSKQFIENYYDELEGSIGKQRAEDLIDRQLRMSMSFDTGGFQGPYYTGKHMLETDCQPTTQANAPTTPT